MDMFSAMHIPGHAGVFVPIGSVKRFEHTVESEPLVGRSPLNVNIEIPRAGAGGKVRPAGRCRLRPIWKTNGWIKKRIGT